MIRKPDLEEVDSLWRPFPLDIIMETSTFCNLKCIMCTQRFLKRPKGKMEFALFKKIADEIVAVSPESRLWLAIVGEPLVLGDELITMLRYGQEIGLKNINLNTNATYLTPEMSGKLLDAGIRNIIVSIDAATAETYDAVRPGGSFETTVKNLESLLAMRKERCLRDLKLTAQFIIMDENEHELEQFKECWLRHGARVKVRLRMGWGTALEAVDLEKANIKRDFPCPWMMRTVSIQWDGIFSQCGADYESIHSPGDLRVQTIKEVWDGELARRRERHRALDFSAQPCNTCRDWSAGRARWFYPEEE